MWPESLVGLSVVTGDGDGVEDEVGSGLFVMAGSADAAVSCGVSAACEGLACDGDAVSFELQAEMTITHNNKNSS
ncbi:hypothetical protein [Paenibacillus sp. NEAU-GSW1]|uniref:hypothetical protein n=1 Tax=Paenibacillus sp. NEAU-GSW1 TaxID=2682486 RepID=UPI001565C741|nr:hypothetical protein [Paenibacillus sp. NEAU-GSW1]